MDRSMDIYEKRALLQALGTAELVTSIAKAEKDLELALQEESRLRSEHQELLAGRSDDCEAVKRAMAEIMLACPAEENGKKWTETDKKNWLLRQRTTDKQLAEIINKQRMAQVVIEDVGIKVEMGRARLADLRQILALRVAQISFFAGDVRITLDSENEIKQEAAASVN